MGEASGNAESAENIDSDGREENLASKSDARDAELEESVDSKFDTEDNKSEFQSKYETASKHYKKELKSFSKKSSKTESGELEKKVSELRSDANKFGIDETEFIAAHLHESLPKYLESKSSEEGEDTNNGVLAFIYHYDEKTRKLEFLFEQVRPDYSSAENRGRLKLYGGTLKKTSGGIEDSIRGFEREIKEEFEPSGAYAILKSLEENDIPYGRKYYTQNGQQGYTDLLDIEVKSEILWQQIKNARTRHDAGVKRVLTDIVAHDKIDDEYYAFGDGPLIKGFIREKSRNPNLKIQDSYFKSLLSSNYHNPLENQIYRNQNWLN